jgi:hypothetical protein
MDALNDMLESGKIDDDLRQELNEIMMNIAAKKGDNLNAKS